LGFAHDLCQRKLGVIVTLSKANASGDVVASDLPLLSAPSSQLLLDPSD
jgi:hypothetical protein